MSDGSISQDELDALLEGVDMGGISSSNSSGREVNIDTATLNTFISGNVDTLKNNLDTVTDADFEVGTPVVEVINREGILNKLSEMVVPVHVDFETGLIGDHTFVLSPEFAKKLVGLVNKEENPELDGMAFSAISEIISQFSGYEITQLSQTGKLSDLSAAPATADHTPKAMVRFPQGNFALISYPIKVEDSAFTLWEVFSAEVADGITKALNGGNDSASNGGLSAGDMASLGATGTAENMGGTNMGMDNMGGMNMNNMNMGGMNMNGMNMGGMNMNGMNMGGMNMNGMNMGGMNMNGMNMNGMNMNGMNMNGMNMGGSNPMNPPNVQSLQYPSLANGTSSVEQGNIGLIMDVNMEMTVELGRTHKLIKEILGMGEGTIIELDKLAGEPVDILVNQKPIAKGEVVVIDENFGVRVTEILSPMERVTDLH